MNHCTPAHKLATVLVAAGALIIIHSIAEEGGAARAAPARPNILFLFSDDHAYQAISAYGSVINRTPQIDRLACEGMLFRNCFVTNSICAPSRAVILTGQYSHRNGVIDNRVRFDGSQLTFPKLLQAAGYQTALLGKWHLKSEPTGFDHWRVLIDQGTYYNPVFLTPAGKTQREGYTTDLINDMALDWLQAQRDNQKPFLLMVQQKAPHREWEPGPKHLTLYDDVEIPEPSTLFDDYQGRASPARLQSMTIAKHLTPRDLKLTPPQNLTPEQLKVWNDAYEPKNAVFRAAGLQGQDLVRWNYQRYIKDYLRCTAAVDDNIGRLLDYLDDSGLAADTVVIYSSDQGFYLGEHGWYDKRWMYEESLRTPLLVRWPGVVRPGSVDTHMVLNLDFAPTLLEIAGVTPPAEVQGRSLVPLLRGEDPQDWRRSLYYRYYEVGPHDVAPDYGVRTERHKLIHYPLTKEWELFDLERDPRELHSIHAVPAHAETVTHLKAELQRLRRQYGDESP